jgi:pilus assembly protein CpaC
VQRFPGLGDIPLLGALFSSQQYQSGKTELVIFVTPRLAQPIAAKEMRLPTDSYVPPGDLDFYLFGRLQGHGESKSSKSTSGNASMEQPPKGTFGHDISLAH